MHIINIGMFVSGVIDVPETFVRKERDVQYVAWAFVCSVKLLWVLR